MQMCSILMQHYKQNNDQVLNLNNAFNLWKYCDAQRNNKPLYAYYVHFS